jgi:hypothetical protein
LNLVLITLKERAITKMAALAPSGTQQEELKPAELAVKDTRREALVTMITSDDFAPGIEALLASISSSQLIKRPVLVLVTPGVSSRVTQKIVRGGGQVVNVDAIAIPLRESAATAGAAAGCPKVGDSSGAETHVDSWVETGWYSLSYLCIWH